jgi:hypothetical protein
LREAYYPNICGEKMRNINKNIFFVHVQATVVTRNPLNKIREGYQYTNPFDFTSSTAFLVGV